MCNSPPIVSLLGDPGELYSNTALISEIFMQDMKLMMAWFEASRGSMVYECAISRPVALASSIQLLFPAIELYRTETPMFTCAHNLGLYGGGSRPTIAQKYSFFSEFLLKKEDFLEKRRNLLIVLWCRDRAGQFSLRYKELVFPMEISMLAWSIQYGRHF